MAELGEQESGSRVSATKGRRPHRGDQYYDRSENRLVYVRSYASAEFWDKQWEAQLCRERYVSAPKRGTLVTRATTKHLPAGARILEGGCGTGLQSYQLFRCGYDVTSLDFAPNTIKTLQERVPEVKPILGDVRRLPFEDASFDGYWSLGVIEHFYDGYEAVCREMRRVIRVGGRLFLTFPYLNPVRRLMIHRGKYPVWNGENAESFYQYALDSRKVVMQFEKSGFCLLEKLPYLGLSGVEDTWPLFERPIAYLRSNGKLARIAGAVTNKFVEPFASHMVLLVFQRL